MGLLSRNRPGADRRNSIVDGLIATTGLTVLSWVFLIQPLVRDSELSLGLKLLSAAYPALDLLLVMLILRLAFGDPAPTPAKVLLLTWGCLQLAGDTATWLLCSPAAGRCPARCSWCGWALSAVSWPPDSTRR